MKALPTPADLFPLKPFSWYNRTFHKNSFLDCIISVITLACISLGCATGNRPPPIMPPPHASSTLSCPSPYVNGTWQFVHSIEATFGGKKIYLTGVTVVSSETGSVKCALMTVEGFVLFEARSFNTLHVIKALPPFDSVSFAEGLIDDIRLIFLRPSGTIQIGYSREGHIICRYTNRDGSITDIIKPDGLTWEIRKYSKDMNLERTVDASIRTVLCHEKPIPVELILTSYGTNRYRIIMRLLDAHMQSGKG